GVGQPDDLLEPLQARLDAVAAVGLIHVLHGRPNLVGVGQQLGAGRLVGDQGVDPAGGGGGEIQPDLGSASVAQHVGGLVAGSGEQGGRVVAVDVQVLVGGGVVGDAPGVAARVQG